MECDNSIVDLLVPLTIINLMGTTLVFFLLKYVDKFFLATCQPPPIEETAAPDQEADGDLIAEVRQASQQNTSQTQEKQEPPLISNSHVPTPTKDAPQQANVDRVAATIAELSGDQRSLDSVAENLVAFSRNMAGAIETAGNMPLEKKKKLSSFLRSVPSIVTQLSDMTEQEITELLTAASLSQFADHTNESDFLVGTLDGLRVAKDPKEPKDSKEPGLASEGPD